MLKHFLELVLMNNNEEVLRRNLEKKIGGFIFLLEGGGRITDHYRPGCITTTAASSILFSRKMKISPRNNYCVCARRTSQLLLFMLFHLSCCISLKQKVYGIKTTRDLFCFSWKLTLNPLRNHDFQFSIRVCCCFGCAIGRIIKKIDPKSFRGPETKVRPLSGRDRVICSARGLEMNPISRPKFHFDLFVCLRRWCRCFSWRAYNRGDGWTGQIIDIYMQSAWKKT